MDKSKFKVGDKVRVISEVLKNVYMPNEHEIITAIDETRGITENRIMLAYPLNDKLEDDDGYYWKDGDLIHYGESPLNQETAPLHAEIQRLKAQLKASNDALVEAKIAIKYALDNLPSTETINTPNVSLGGIAYSAAKAHDILKPYDTLRPDYTKKQVASWDSAAVENAKEESEGE